MPAPAESHRVLHSTGKPAVPRPRVRAAGDFDLSLVIPAHDEARRLPQALDRLAAWLASLPLRVEVIVVDDGSGDATAIVAAAHPIGCGVIRLAANSGKGAAVRVGMLAARGRVVAFTDADVPYRMDALNRAFALIASGGADLACGARDLDASAATVRRATHREVASAAFRALCRVLVSRDVRDTQCGLKAFSMRAAREIFPRVHADGFGFDAEVILVARRLGLVAARVPVVLVSDAGSTVSVRRHAPRMIREVVRAAWHHARAAGPKTAAIPRHEVLRTAEPRFEDVRRVA